jgi:hypothetical protein
MRNVCYLRRLEDFFGAVDSRNEMFVHNNIFSSFVLGDGLCCSFPAWKNVLSFIWNVLDGNTKFCPCTLCGVGRTRDCLAVWRFPSFHLPGAF